MSPPGSGREKVDSKAAVKPLMLTIKVVGQEKGPPHHEDDQQAPGTHGRVVPQGSRRDIWHGIFLYDGMRVRGNMTPVDLEMEDGDMLDFFEHMDGGAGPFIIGSM
ncbi:hypothetical protein CFC21_013318 [Triticum aestivum]|uniref:Ubiquitin-like domain-containing protein n=2 Tax=Triticum aestivum TaxID=4565 RepID=A0A3B5ZZX5_WHEAT|nr:hypothetical protein CFC21_013318 [Triticum aestivum]